MIAQIKNAKVLKAFFKLAVFYSNGSIFFPSGTALPRFHMTRPSQTPMEIAMEVMVYSCENMGEPFRKKKNMLPLE